MNARLGTATAALVMAVAGCGGGGGTSSSSPEPASSPSPSPTTSESVSCQPVAQQFVDRFKALEQRADADTLDIDTLNAGATALRRVYSRVELVCSPPLTKAAALANYQTSLATANLTACQYRPVVCKSTQSKAGDAVTKAFAQVDKIDALLHPTS